MLKVTDVDEIRQIFTPNTIEPFDDMIRKVVGRTEHGRWGDWRNCLSQDIYDIVSHLIGTGMKEKDVYKLLGIKVAVGTPRVRNLAERLRLASLNSVADLLDGDETAGERYRQIKARLENAGDALTPGDVLVALRDAGQSREESVEIVFPIVFPDADIRGPVEYGYVTRRSNLSCSVLTGLQCWLLKNGRQVTDESCFFARHVR